MDWIHKTRGRNKWRAVVYRPIKIKCPLNAGIFLEHKESFVSDIIIIIILIIVISFMQGIYTYIPETNHDPRENSVAAILSLLFIVPISLVPALALLYFYVSTFRSMCAVPNMAVSWYVAYVFSE